MIVERYMLQVERYMLQVERYMLQVERYMLQVGGTSAGKVLTFVCFTDVKGGVSPGSRLLEQQEGAANRDQARHSVAPEIALFEVCSNQLEYCRMLFQCCRMLFGCCRMLVWCCCMLVWCCRMLFKCCVMVLQPRSIVQHIAYTIGQFNKVFAAELVNCSARSSTRSTRRVW